MSLPQSRTQLFAVVIGAIALSAVVFFGSAPFSNPADAEEVATADLTPADQAAARDVSSVCEAQYLKADIADEGKDPAKLEIPAEYNGPWPSLSACEAHEAALDEETEGPLQPIPFSHKHHAGEFEIACLYCHSNTDRSQAAGVPSVQICMGCHASFPKEFDELEGIQTLKQHWEEQTPIEWIQIHRLPEHVQFRHNRHVAKGVACETCHGPVAELDKLYLVPDMRFVNGMPARKLQMGWCVDCHRENEAPTNCVACHY